MLKNKWWLAILAFCFWVSCQSCFQFRLSDKKQYKTLQILPAGFATQIGTIKSMGRDIHYTYVVSDSTKPLAVFVHGLPGSSSSFIDFAKDTLLLGSFNVLLLDRPGFGYSNFGKSESSIEQQAKMLLHVVKQIGNTKKYLIGHSLGGPIICRMAMEDSSAIDGLLIIAGSVSPELEPQENWRKPMQKKTLRWLMPKSFRVSNDEIIEAKEELIKMEPLWPQIICDVQIIQGGKDKLVPAGNEDYAEMMLVNAKSVRVYRLPELNHFIPFTQPQLVVEALQRF